MPVFDYQNLVWRCGRKKIGGAKPAKPQNEQGVFDVKSEGIPNCR